MSVEDARAEAKALNVRYTGDFNQADLNAFLKSLSNEFKGLSTDTT